MLENCILLSHLVDDFDKIREKKIGPLKYSRFFQFDMPSNVRDPFKASPGYEVCKCCVLLNTGQIF